MKGGHRKEMGAGERKGLGLFAFVSVIFFTVSGGAYGLESLVGAVGPAWAVLLVLVTPFLWALPISMMVAELATAMPEEGGYYIWVRRALGPFWGMQAGWWIICYSVVDMAIYPVLFVNYLAYFVPSLAGNAGGVLSGSTFLARWLIAIFVIAAGLTVNLRGAFAVGRSAIVNVILVLFPFGLLVITGLSKGNAPAALISSFGSSPLQGETGGLVALGLSTVLWNYCGWDNVSTIAREVHAPEAAYKRGLGIALPLIVGAYLLPLIAGLAVAPDAGLWSEARGWPFIAAAAGGRWLGVLVAAAALCSAYSLFNSQLLYISRLPRVMARDGWLPGVLGRKSKGTGVPAAAITASCCLTALFAALPFGKLVVIDILLYSGGLLAQFAALIVLRRKAPTMARPFRVPGGFAGAVLAGVLPMCLAATVAWTSLKEEPGAPLQILIVAGLIAAGLIVYLVRKRSVHGAVTLEKAL